MSDVGSKRKASTMKVTFKGPLRDVLHDCRRMLFIRGSLTESEDWRVRRRIDKEYGDDS